MSLHNAINSGVAVAARLPVDCEFRDDVLANLEPESPVSQWSQGFTLGHNWLTETWDPYVPEEYDEEFGAMVMALSFFNSRKLAEAYRKETRWNKSLQTMATSMRDIFPEALQEYARLGRNISQIIAEHEAADHAPSSVIKAGRNDPCPCGSGRKFKKCCGAAVREK